MLYILGEVLTAIDQNNIKTFTYDNSFDKRPVCRRNKMRMFKIIVVWFKKIRVLFESIWNIVHKNTKLLDSLSGDVKRAIS